jgi:hypothetical protein
MGAQGKRGSSAIVASALALLVLVAVLAVADAIRLALAFTGAHTGRGGDVSTGSDT